MSGAKDKKAPMTRDADEAALPEEIETALRNYVEPVRQEASAFGVLFSRELEGRVDEAGRIRAEVKARGALVALRAALRTALSRSTGGGGETVAWAVVDKNGEFYDAAPLRSKEYAEKRAPALNRTRDGYPTPYRVVPLYAAPTGATGGEYERARQAFYEAAARNFIVEFDCPINEDGPSREWYEMHDASSREAGQALRRLREAEKALARNEGGERRGM